MQAIGRPCCSCAAAQERHTQAAACHGGTPESERVGVRHLLAEVERVGLQDRGEGRVGVNICGRKGAAAAPGIPRSSRGGGEKKTGGPLLRVLPHRGAGVVDLGGVKGDGGLWRGRVHVHKVLRVDLSTQ